MIDNFPTGILTIQLPIEMYSALLHFCGGSLNNSNNPMKEWIYILGLG